MNILRSLVVVVAMVAIAGCERKSDVAAPQTAQCGDVTFQFPQNWKATVKDMGFIQMARVESPGNAVAVLTVYPIDHDISVRSYTESFVETMVGSGSFAKIEGGAVKEKNGVLGVAVVATVAGASVPHTLQVSEHKVGGRKVFCLTQVADKDMGLVDAGFGLIRSTIAETKKDAATPPNK